MGENNYPKITKSDINKLKNIVTEDGLEITANKIGISIGHFHKLIYNPDHNRITPKMKKRIHDSEVLD